MTSPGFSLDIFSLNMLLAGVFGTKLICTQELGLCFKGIVTNKFMY